MKTRLTRTSRRLGKAIGASVAGLTCLLVPALVFAQNLNLPKITVESPAGDGSVGPVELVLFLTVLTFLPAIILTMTSFTRIVIVLFFVRQAMGVQHAPPNQVIIGLALFITIFVMKPVWTEIQDVSLEPYLNNEIKAGEAVSNASDPIKKYMLANTGEKDLVLFFKVSGAKLPKTREELSLYQLVPAFVTSEIKIAFKIGFLIFLPFLVLDMLVASILMSMGMMMLPPIIISLPFKLILFVLIDGWNLVIGSLISGIRI